MINPNMLLVANADNAGLVRTNSNEHPVVAIEACKAGLGRSNWWQIEAPTGGRGIEHWYQSSNGDLAYSQEVKGAIRLVIFNAEGKAIADIHHAIRQAA